MTSYSFTEPSNYADQQLRIIRVESLLSSINEFNYEHDLDKALVFWESINKLATNYFNKTLIDELIEDSRNEYEFTDSLKKVLKKELKNLNK